MRYPRLLWGILSISAQRELAYRTNLVFQALLTAFGLAAGVAALGMVYTRTQALAGWRIEEATVLLGTYGVVSGLMEAFVNPNLAFFATKVRGGELDDVLLQPVPSVLLASLGTCQPWALAQVVLYGGVVALGVSGLEGGVASGNLFGYLLLLLSGVVLGWASRVLLASVAFWAPQLDTEVMYGALWQLGRYPVGVYHPVVRWMLTYVFPVAFVSTIPARALTRGADAPVVLGGALAALGAIWLVGTVWNAGVRRYTSATS